ncbi:MAG: aldehyde dehydrogenase family protein [Actinomycetota bacterium]|nr:aldehyde dehydrogenase family protein [Actinomycetota bacterium]
MVQSGWTYDPARESRAVARLHPSYGVFVDGEFVDGGGPPLTTVDPATEQVLAEVGTANGADVDTAVRAARRAYDRVWSRMSGAERAKYLFRIARLVEERARELAVLESLDTGTPIRETRDVLVPAAAAHFFHHAGWADKLAYAGYGPDPQPLGVAGQVVAWHSPLLAAAWKIAPALACGNTVVLKPAETTPLGALVLGDICQQAELPPGVVNILPGDGAVGAALVGHGGLDAVAFTGSGEVGRRIQRILAGTGRKLTLELGGGVATIVFDDAPLDQAVEGLVAGTFVNRTPLGAAGSRLLVAEPVADELGERLRARLDTLRVGEPLDKNTDVGAVVSRCQLDRITAFAATGDDEGARRWTAPATLPLTGYFFPPTVFTGVSQEMRIARDEVAGPVLPVLTFRTPDEAVAMASDRTSGLSAAVWTEKGSRALWTAQRLRAGVVWANTAHRVDPTAPVGGYGESGLGREGGRAGLEAYLHV